MLFKRVAIFCALLLIMCAFSGCGGSTSSTPTASASPAIATQPSDQLVTVGQPATFSVVASGMAPFAYQWQKNSQPISGAISSSYTTPSTATADNSSKFSVVVSNSLGHVTSDSAVLSVQQPPDVTTFHNDNLRTGQNVRETYLTPASVNATTFGKLGFLATDGRVDAQPLYLAGVAIPGIGIHNVLYVVTEHDSVYAFDADTQALLWQATALEAGETSSDDRQCSDAVTPEIGITATPVIDRTRGPNGAIYLVAATEDSGGAYHFRLHAIDVATGAELFGGPTEIQGQYAGYGAGSSGGMLTFDQKQYLARAALLAANGTIYVTFGSHCDFPPYTGWMMGYDEATLHQSSVLNLTPNGHEGGIWMSGDGPAADTDGNIFLVDGNGLFDTTLTANGFPSNNDFGNAFVKISPSSATVTDYFTPHDTEAQSDADLDLGSGGVLLLPDQVDDAGKTWHLGLASGKTGLIYVVDRDNMGKFNSAVDNILEEIPQCCQGLYGEMFSTPAYFNSNVYYGAWGVQLRSFAIVNAKVALPYATFSSEGFPYPGATPSVSANGTSDGLVWAVENETSGILHAYAASDLGNEVYTSLTNAIRDQFGANKFVVPTVTNGKVYVGTLTGVAVFGLLPTGN